jgi:hypothetical protein
VQSCRPITVSEEEQRVYTKSQIPGPNYPNSHLADSQETARSLRLVETAREHSKRSAFDASFPYWSVIRKNRIVGPAVG